MYHRTAPFTFDFPRFTDFGLIAQAELHQRNGEPLPVDLYAELVSRGYDANEFDPN